MNGDDAADFGRTSQRGYALVIAILILASLLTLVLPFLFAVRQHADASAHGFDISRSRVLEEVAEQEARVRMDATSADMVIPGEPLRRVGDLTPRWDSTEEIVAAARGGAAAAVEQLERLFDANNPAAGIWGATISDERSRIDLNTAPALTLAALFHRVDDNRGWLTWTGEDITGTDTEISVQSTAGFPASGALYINGERVEYRSKDDSVFKGCSRGGGSGSDPGYLFLPQGPHKAGTLVMDDRVHRVVRWRILGNLQAPRRYASVDEIRRIAEGDLEAFLPRRLVRLLRPHLTVHGEPGWGGYWTRWVPVRSPGQASVVPVIISEDPALGSRGGLLQVHHALGRSAIESPCFHIARGGGGGALVVHNEPADLPDLPGAVGRFMVRSPVNINTAGRDVLAAMFTGLKLRGGRLSDRISPDLAEQLADMLIELRGGDRMGTQLAGVEDEGLRREPFRDWEDFVRRFLDLAAGMSENLGDWPQLTQRQRLALYYNAEDPNSSALDYASLPVCFDSGINFRAVARAVSSGAAGQKRRADGAQTVFQAAPLVRQFSFHDDQQGFEELFRLNRMAHWMTTGPNPQEWLGGARGAQMRTAASPASRAQARLQRGDPGQLFPYWVPSVEEDRSAARYRSGDEEENLSSFVQAQATIHEDVYGTNRIHHFDREPEVEGRDTGREGRGPYRLDAAANNVGLVTQQGRLWPFTVSGWFCPRDVGDQSFLQLEADSSGEARSRITLAIEGEELVLRFFDHQGDDPETEILEACEHRITLGEEVILEEDTWYHFRAIVRGARPSDVLVMVDGFPQGRPRYVTWLTGAVGPDGDRLPVESTEGFPKYGALRVGDEVIEYTSVSGKTFNCSWQRSDNPLESAWTGGRGARQQRSGNAAIGQEHAEGTLVELYGYASMLRSNFPVGGGTLDGDLGPFAVGRLANGPTDIIVEIPDPRNPSAPRISILLGTGYEAADGDGGQIELIDPTTGGESAYAEAFQANGGFAMLAWNVGNNLQTQGQPILETIDGTPLGGAEIIRYESRESNVLSGVQRGFMDLEGTSGLGGQGQGQAGFPFGDARAYVTEWAPGLTVNQDPEPQTNPRYWVWVIPLSVKATAASEESYLAPTERDPKRIQIFHPEYEGLTEWIEYTEIYQNHFLRSDAATLQRIYSIVGSFERGVHDGAGDWPEKAQEGWLGREPEEVPSKAAEDIHRLMQMRGRYGTFNQYHESDLDIHPVFDVCYQGAPTFNASAPPGQQWNTLGMTATRPGRGDRVAFRVENDAVSPVQWHTVNWVWTRQNDNRTFIALKEVTPQGFIVDLTRQRPLYFDTRDELRMLKFPCGELPGGFTRVRIGEGIRNDGGNMEVFEGLVDEIEFEPLGGQGPPRVPGRLENMAQYLLKEALPEGTESGEILLRPNSLDMPQGVMHSRGAARTGGWAQDAGVVRIGEELIVYSELQTDDEGVHLRLARGGRGFLGTEKQGHGIGDRVHPLTALEVSELSGSLSADGFELNVESGQGFYSAGTLLIEEEVLHYTRHSASGNSDAQAVLSMPRTTDAPGTYAGPSEASGAFRGRYGTMIASHSTGALVYRLPFRYWDRTVIVDERGKLPQVGTDRIRIADLAQSSYLGFALSLRGAYFQALHWDEYLWGDPNIDVWALVRIDGEVPGQPGSRVAWDAFPSETRGRRIVPQEGSSHDLLLMNEPGDLAQVAFNPINRAGNLLEVRLFFVFKPGSFQPFGQRPNSWKRTPNIEELGVLYTAESKTLHRVKLR